MTQITKFDDVILGKMYWDDFEKEMMVFFEKNKNSYKAFCIKLYEEAYFKYNGCKIETINRDQWDKINKKTKDWDYVFSSIIPKMSDDHAKILINWIFSEWREE